MFLLDGVAVIDVDGAVDDNDGGVVGDWDDDVSYNDDSGSLFKSTKNSLSILHEGTH